MKVLRVVEEQPRAFQHASVLLDYAPLLLEHEIVSHLFLKNAAAG